MTHITFKQPLEKLQESVLAWWAVITLSILPYVRRVRAAWQILIGQPAYQGARYIPDEESIPWQCRMAAALGGSERALIVTRFIQWTDHNKSEGRPATTHNGYGDWIERHFWHLKPGAFGGHIRALEKMGVLKTQRIGKIDSTRKYDQRKSYRIDHMRLNALIAAVKVPHLDAETSNSKAKEAHSNLNNDSNSSNQSLKPNPITQEKPTNQGRGGRRAGAGRKSKYKEALIEPAKNATAGQSSVEDSMGTAGDQDGPSPNSAPPPSHLEVDVMERMTSVGLEDDKAAALIEQYGANRVRAVVRECERRLGLNEIKRPAGWIIAELKNDVFKLGEIAAEPDSDSHALAGDAAREERMRRETERLERLMAEEEFEVG